MRIVWASLRVWRRATACRHPSPRSIIVSGGQGSFPPSVADAETSIFILRAERITTKEWSITQPLADRQENRLVKMITVINRVEIAPVGPNLRIHRMSQK